MRATRDSPLKIRFAQDSPAEGRRFEPSVPRRIDNDFQTALFASAALPVPPETPTHFARGTESSNLLSSSGESGANLFSGTKPRLCPAIFFYRGQLPPQPAT